VRERGKGGKVEGRYEEKTEAPLYSLLKYVPIAYFLPPLAKLLPLTIQTPPKKTKDGRTKDTVRIFFVSFFCD
jgi:hypothetical protein